MILDDSLAALEINLLLNFDFVVGFDHQDPQAALWGLAGDIRALIDVVIDPIAVAIA
ncbi:MAG: hypothetical protein R3C68_08245 [Myxococcota bacterium]